MSLLIVLFSEVLFRTSDFPRHLFTTARASLLSLQISGDKHTRIAYLEQKLREDLAREEKDLMELERQMGLTRDMISAKKRQLEIKKRQPYQCLVNIVQCF